ARTVAGHRPAAVLDVCAHQLPHLPRKYAITTPWSVHSPQSAPPRLDAFPAGAPLTAVRRPGRLSTHTSVSQWHDMYDLRAERRSAAQFRVSGPPAHLSFKRMATELPAWEPLS